MIGKYYIFDRKTANEATKETIRQEFTEKIENEKAGKIQKTMKKGGFSIYLGEEYFKYYSLIKQKFGKEYKYKVKYYYGEYTFTHERDGIVISWR